MAQDETHLPEGGVRGDDDRAAGDLKPGGEHEDRKRKDELLDEALEETFPGSDPVAVKHIT